ncbi:hypothetical protein OH773_08280 [Buttiauxella sp. WJP83]|uniref:hypothetical protein n=1 Tax=Buttiauxella sp. WJP83 TaxID=2986951 RepID=UPI0022DD846D|nr:hypothetical protein [Buttiauxella sp. WJP83]WBM72220.1 hypothetical protein OH773_08280 [Buttiauxella sp. WJP83]
MQLVNNKSIVSSKDLDFIALSFARMRSQGRYLCPDAITGNMDESCKTLFLKHYATCYELLQEKASAM